MPNRDVCPRCDGPAIKSLCSECKGEKFIKGVYCDKCVGGMYEYRSTAKEDMRKARRDAAADVFRFVAKKVPLSSYYMDLIKEYINKNYSTDDKGAESDG